MLLGGCGGKIAGLYNGKWLLLLFKRLSYRLKVHRLKAMGSGDTNTLSRLKPTFAAAQTAAFRRRSFGGSGPFGTS